MPMLCLLFRQVLRVVRLASRQEIQLSDLSVIDESLRIVFSTVLYRVKTLEGRKCNLLRLYYTSL